MNYTAIQNFLPKALLQQISKFQYFIMAWTYFLTSIYSADVMLQDNSFNTDSITEYKPAHLQNEV